MISTSVNPNRLFIAFLLSDFWAATLPVYYVDAQVMSTSHAKVVRHFHFSSLSVLWHVKAAKNDNQEPKTITNVQE